MSTNTTIYDDDTYIVGDEITIVLIFKYIASSLSLFGSIFMMSSYIYFKLTVNNETRSRANSQTTNKNSNLKMGWGHDMLFCLALSDFIHSVSSFVKTSDFTSGTIDSSCIAQGILMNFGEISSVSWTSVIAMSIYLGTVVTDFGKVKKFLFYFYVYVTSILLTFLPFITNSYGVAGAWCWLNTKNLDDSDAWLWSMGIYIFHWCNIVFNIFAVCKTIKYFKIRAFEIEEDNQEQSNFLKNFCIVLKFFPIILIICWVPATINRIYLFATGIENTFLYTIHAFSSSLIGFLNALVYSYYYKSHIKSCILPKVEVKEDTAHIEMENNEYVKNVTLESDKNKNIDNI